MVVFLFPCWGALECGFLPTCLALHHREQRTDRMCQTATFLLESLLGFMMTAVCVCVCLLSLPPIFSLWYYSASCIVISVPLQGKEDCLPMCRLFVSLYFLNPNSQSLWGWVQHASLGGMKLALAGQGTDRAFETQWDCASSHTDHKCLDQMDHSCGPEMANGMWSPNPGAPREGQISYLPSLESNISSELQKCIWAPEDSCCWWRTATGQVYHPLSIPFPCIKSHPSPI